MDPMDASAQVNLSNTLAAVGFVQLKMGRAKEQALANFKRQRELAEKLVAADPLRIEHRYSLSEAIENIGMVSVSFASKTNDAQEKRRHLAEAKGVSLKQALEIYDKLKARGAVSAEYAGVPARIAQELASTKIDP